MPTKGTSKRTQSRTAARRKAAPPEVQEPIASESSEMAIATPPTFTLSTLDSLIEDINAIYGKLEEAESVAVSAAQSAFTFAREMGDRLLEAKKLAGHGQWEATRQKIISPRTGCPIPSTTAALYQRIADRWAELQAAECATIREAAELLKSGRQIKSATVADLEPTEIVKDLQDSLEGLRDRFEERRAVAEQPPATTPDEISAKYGSTSDIAVPQIGELMSLYGAICTVAPTKDGKGFKVESDLGNPFPLFFRSRTEAWDYWRKHEDRLRQLMARVQESSVVDEPMELAIASPAKSSSFYLNPPQPKAEDEEERERDKANTPEVLWGPALKAFDVSAFELDMFTNADASVPALVKWTRETDKEIPTLDRPLLKDDGKPFNNLWLNHPWSKSKLLVPRVIEQIKKYGCRNIAWLTCLDPRTNWWNDLLDFSGGNVLILPGYNQFEGWDDAFKLSICIFPLQVDDLDRFASEYESAGVGIMFNRRQLQGLLESEKSEDYAAVINRVVGAIGIRRVMSLLCVAATIRKEEQIVLDMVNERLMNRKVL